MTTVGRLIEERRNLILRKHVWEVVKEYLGRYMPRGDDQPEDHISTEFGIIPTEIVSDVLAEIDADCVCEIEAQIHNIDHLEVQHGKERSGSRAAKKNK